MIGNPPMSRKKLGAISKENKVQVRFQGSGTRMRFRKAERTLDSCYG